MKAPLGGGGWPLNDLCDFRLIHTHVQRIYIYTLTDWKLLFSIIFVAGQTVVPFVQEGVGIQHQSDSSRYYTPATIRQPNLTNVKFMKINTKWREICKIKRSILTYGHSHDIEIISRTTPEKIQKRGVTRNSFSLDDWMSKKKYREKKKICGWWRGLKNKTPVFPQSKTRHSFKMPHYIPIRMDREHSSQSVRMLCT